MESKHTKGEWTATQTSISDSNGVIATTYVNTVKRYIGKQEAEANASLIAEAGTVANETGKTPREILNERNELLDACINAYNMINKAPLSAMDILGNAINKATK